MNKKKACIESLAAQESQEPSRKITKYDSSEAITPSPTQTPNVDKGVSTVIHDCQQSSPVEGVPGFQKFDQILPGGRNDSEQNIKSLHLNNLIFTSKLQTVLHEKYQTKSDHHDDVTGINLSCFPFRHCIFPNFIVNQDCINDLELSLLDLPLREKNNDLYKFSQSQDLNHSKSSTISAFRSACDVVKNFISRVTDIPLNRKVDLFCSQYKYTDVLLCHDDELEERRIAFIYYLVPETWSSSDGGTLDLFDTDDENKQPKGIVKSFIPKRNSFLFFEVTATSFHQVAEVLSENKIRLAISGWFHGPPLPRPSPYIDTLPPAVPYGSIEEDIFYAWFNPLYLAPEVQSNVRQRFEEDSEIELTDFLQEEKYNELVSALQAEGINWSLLGPANKRNYYAADRESLPQVVSEFLRIIHSDAAFLALSHLTGLKLHSLAPTLDADGGESASVNGEPSTNEGVSNPRCRSEVRRWEHGCYTLAHDTDTEILDFALDTVMYIGCEKEWSFENGGYTSYIAKGEEEELLSMCPSGNSLALVYRDKDTMRFVKHLNHRITKLTPPRFFEINTVYYE